MLHSLHAARHEALCDRCMANSGILAGLRDDAVAELLGRGWRYLAREHHIDDGQGRWWCADCKDKPMTIPKRAKRTR